MTTSARRRPDRRGQPAVVPARAPSAVRRSTSSASCRAPRRRARGARHALRAARVRRRPPRPRRPPRARRRLPRRPASQPARPGRGDLAAAPPRRRRGRRGPPRRRRRSRCARRVRSCSPSTTCSTGRTPAYLTAAKRRYLQRRRAPLGAPGRRGRRARAEYVRGTVVDAFGTDPEQVVVVPHGVDAPSTWTDEETLRSRYRLGRRRFVVYPAVTHPHKNHRFLFELLAGPWADPDLLLVLLGGSGLAEARGGGGDRATSVCGARVDPTGPGRRRRPRRLAGRRRRARVPVRVRGLRGARAGGDGARHAGRVQRSRRPARGRRRRRHRASAHGRGVGRRPRRGAPAPGRAGRRRPPTRRLVHHGRRRASRLAEAYRLAVHR